MSVMPQNLRNAADYMQKVSGVDPTWLREAADEMERLRSIAAERMALFHQAATKVEQLSEQLVLAKGALDRITVFQVEEDRRVHIRICGEELLPAQAGTSSARALLEFDAIQRLVSKTDDYSEK